MIEKRNIIYGLLALNIIRYVATDTTWRLPLEVIPVEYELELVPYLDKAGGLSFTFNGTAHISVKARKEASRITLHSKDLEIDKITSTSFLIMKYDLEENRDFLVIYVKDSLKLESIHNITIEYRGKIKRNSAGFYRSAEITSSGEIRWMGATQLQPTNARRVFPCFDEPALKSNFLIRIAPPTGLEVVSNMPVDTISSPDPKLEGRNWYNFKRSPVMSTYSVAFVISTFSKLQDGLISILTSVGKIEFSNYALSVSPKIISAFVTLTGQEYPLPKLDHIAIQEPKYPAMENWGLIIYRSEYILVNEEDQDNTLDALILISHEISHNWFGGLITPEWWSYTWLKEGFAMFFQYYIADKVDTHEPLFSKLITALHHDVINEEDAILSHPLTREIDSPQQINGVFDTITFNKGASIINMIYHFLSEPTFIKGLQICFKKKAYQTFKPDDLFAAWQEAAEEDNSLHKTLTVKAILDTWTLQARYPLLTVTRDYKKGTATITQTLFKGHCKCSGDERWYVPITYTTRKERDFSSTKPKAWLLPQKDSKVILTGLEKDDWLILNVQSVGYYRVNYDERNWKLILSALEKPTSDGIHPFNKMQLIHDAERLGNIKKLTPNVSMGILRSLGEEQETNVVSTVLEKLANLVTNIMNSEFMQYLKRLFQPLVDKISSYFQPERNLLTETQQLKELEDWNYALSDSQDTRTLDGSSNGVRRPAKWCAAVRLDAGAWDAAWRRYENALSTGVRRDALAALGCARDASRLMDAVAAAANPDDAGIVERVRAEDVGAALAAPCGSETRRAVGGGGEAACAQALAFLADNPARVQSLLGDSDDYLSLVRRLAQRVRTEEQYNMLQSAATTVRVGQRPLLGTDLWTDVLATARTRVDWASGDGAPVLSWLREHARREL